MSINNSILLSLNIKDENIVFSQNFVEIVKIKNILSLVYNAVLIYDTIDYCEKCGAYNDGDIIKNGTKTSLIKLNKVSQYNTYIRLKKQRFLCRHCNITFIAKTEIVNAGCFISNDLKRGTAINAQKKKSNKDIGCDYNV